MPASTDPGVFASARGVLTTAIEILRTRLQLLGVDIEEQAHRWVQSLILVLLAAGLLLVGVVCAGVLITLWLWEWNRALAVAFVVVVPFGGAALCLMLGLRRLRAPPRAFDASLTELDKDLAALRSEP